VLGSWPLGIAGNSKGIETRPLCFLCSFVANDFSLCPTWKNGATDQHGKTLILREIQDFHGYAVFFDRNPQLLQFGLPSIA
jgi:hypothetical protein